jgi:Bifunctional DNA primase/polymerase, N-terminal
MSTRVASPRRTAQSSLEIALVALKRFPGLHLFPVAPENKAQPLLKAYLKRASNDPSQLRRWHAYWKTRFGGRECWWGIAPELSGLVFADIDTKPGKPGQETFELFELLNGWPPTLVTRSPSGGRHHWYRGRHLFAVGSDKTQHPGIDFAQYVILPGCMKSDGTGYTWQNNLPIANAPEWFYIEVRRTAERSPPADHCPVVELDQPANIEWAREFLRKDAPPAIEGQGGDATTFAVAAELRDHAISLPMAVELMATYYNEQKCEPPWPIDELTKKVENGFNYANLIPPGGDTAEAEFAKDDNCDVSEIPTFGDAETIAREAAERTVAKSDNRPRIDVDKANLPKIVRRVQTILIESAGKASAKPADQVFQRSGSLVHLSRNRLKPGTTFDKYFHVENDLLITPVEDGWLADRLERSICFGRLGKKRGASGKSKTSFIATEVPRIIIQRLAAIKQDWEYPTLAGTVEAPTLRLDGTILDKPGYDRRTGLYFDPGLATFPPIKTRPTEADARIALDTLKGPLADFPFADEDGIEGLSQSVALAMLLTAVCRRSLPNAPMFGIDANEAQSGKTELAQVAAIVMTGRRTAARPFSSDEYQRATALAAAFEAGDSIILYDNIDGDKMAVEGEALCMALTEERFQMRRLGGNSASDQIVAPTNALITATGNKLTASGDMAEDRMLICNLRTDKPLAERKFDHWPLDEHVIKNRPDLVSAALTILRAYAVANDKTPGPHFRFAEWRSIVADALVWLGLPDPVLSTVRVKADDPIKDAMREVMREWVRSIGEGKEQTTKSVLDQPDVQRAIAEARGINPSKLTNKAAVLYLKGMVGIDLFGHKLSRWKDPSDKVTRWLVTGSPGAAQIEKDLPADEGGPAEEFREDDLLS